MTRRILVPLDIRGGSGQANLIAQGPINVNGGTFPQASTLIDVDVQGHLLVENGAELLGDVVLNRDPDQPMEAATKQYADGLVVISASDPIATYPQCELWYQP